MSGQIDEASSGAGQSAGHPKDQVVLEQFAADAQSVGALHGSARGNRNIQGRIRAMGRLGELAGGTLLDVGCGSGEYTIELAESFDTVHGIDIEPERLAVFESKKPDNCTISAMSVADLQFENHTFDVVTMIEVLEHLADTTAALQEIRRVLKPGGMLFLTTPNRKWPLEQHGVLVGEKRYPSYYAPGLVWIKPLHKRFSDADAFTEANLRELGDRSGMELTGVTYMMPPLDSLGEGHKVHELLDKLEQSPVAGMGQTIVAAFRAPDDLDLR